MARIEFKEGESILGTAIFIALLGALLVAAIAFAWVHRRDEMNGTDANRPTSMFVPSAFMTDVIVA